MAAKLKYMTIVRTLTVLLLYFWTLGNAHATHIVGAEIHYQHISGNSYKFTLEVYRDCRECKFNNIGGGDNMSSCNEVPDLQIKGAVGTSYVNTQVGTIAVNRVAIKDMSGNCYNTLNKCRGGSNTSFGYEMHVFEGIYDFSNAIDAGYCMLDVSIGMSSRNINLNNQFTEQNFFNYSTINLCEGIANSSTEFTSQPQFLLVANQSNYQSLGVLSKDGDSLAFNLRPALRNRTVSVSYANGFDYDHPLSFFCSGAFPCPANINGPIVEGFYMNRQTGDVAFTPIMVNQGAVIVVECEEWKKRQDGTYFLAGVTRRDIYSEVTSQNNNLPKIKNRQDVFEICEGQELSIDLDLEDLPALGMSADSLFASISSTLNGSQLLTLPRNTAPFNSYTINCGNTVNKVGRHYITVTVWDNHCPLRGSVSKTFVVNVRRSRTNAISYNVKNCGILDVSSTSLGNTSIYWTISDMQNNVIKEQYSRKISVQLPAGGTYQIKSYLPIQGSFCELNQVNIIEVSPFKKPVIQMGADLFFCKGVATEISPARLDTFDNYQVLVNGQLTSFPYKFKAESEQSLTFRIAQEDGCFAEDHINLKLHPVLDYKVKDDTFCVNSVFPAKVKNIQLDPSRIFAIQMNTKEPGVSLYALNAKEWLFENISQGSKDVTVYSVIQDKNLCNYKDTFVIRVVEPSPVNLNVPEFVCINQGALELPANPNGHWTCINRPDLLNGKILEIDNTSNANYQLEYTEKIQCEQTIPFEIKVKDTTMIMSGYGAYLEICQSQSPFALQANPSGGLWTGQFVNDQNEFDAHSAAGTMTKVKYTYTNANACISNYETEIGVERLPDLELLKSREKVCVGDQLVLSANTNSADPGYWYTDGNGTIEQSNSRITNYTPNLSDVSRSFITFTYTLQTNGVCGNVSAETIVVVRNGQVGEIIKDYPTEICEPANIRFTTNYQRIEKQYWMVNDSIYEEFDYNFPFNATLKAGEYVIKTLIFDSACQAMAISEPITVLPKPTMQWYSNPGYKLSREYPRLYLKDLSYCKFGHTANWYLNGMWISDSREINLKIEDQKDTFNIKLVSTSGKGGCLDSMSQNFIFTPINQLYIPNAFSPDSKGPQENNSFKVIGPPMKYFKIEIFNRFGEKVYMSFDMNASWDGTYKNEICIQGDYFYKIETTDSEGISRDYSGTVTIIR